MQTKQWIMTLVLTVLWQLMTVSIVQADHCNQGQMLLSTATPHASCQSCEPQLKPITNPFNKTSSIDNHCIDCSSCVTSSTTGLINQPLLFRQPKSIPNYPTLTVQFTEAIPNRLLRPPIYG
ncbi:hypothetical protein H0A36_02180 [Endozoicomonas sp. SM1973]|uniref:Uncharacterized protein n=1 Tax=Spartinivicinus marinus TaxID=2994442 RepID=A0A853IBL8_9GAMM|nr:hypothetical protein [Spartinivicinus marinus]MCX4029960.1 hypothetical protein [Spartinivicinus marinus]NYZ64796.1 hypothetical protein [Spartinivicinus marinus]